MKLVLIENQNNNQSFLYKQIVDKKIMKQAIFDDLALSKQEVEMFRKNPDSLLALYTTNEEEILA